jgi:CRP-like cAMP-binding protein
VFSEIDNYVAKCISLTKEEKEYFHSLLEYKTIKKKSFLQQAGEVCGFEGYIIKGCIKMYYIDENGFEVIIHFAVEDWCIGDIANFSDHKKSTLNLEALEDTELLIIKIKDKEKLYEKVPKFERMFRLMIQRTHETLMNRLISTISKPAEDRYKDFIAKYPSIPQRVPQHLIASFLGISPEFLSKLKAKLAKKKD